MIRRLVSIVFLFSILFIPILSTAQENSDSTIIPVEKKSPMGALIRSVAFPGWGQFYNEKYLKAALVFGIETTYIVLAADEWRKSNFHKKNFQSAPPYSAEQYWEFDQYQFHRDRRNLYLWVISGIVFLSMFDAYVDAHLNRFDKERMEDLKVELLPEFDQGPGMKVLFSLKF
jgi:hypothetical protein